VAQQNPAENRVMTPRPGRPHVALAAAAAVAVALAIMAPGDPAVAHSRQTIPDAAYYRTDLTAVVPSPSGVAVRVDPAGDYIQLTDTGGVAVVVLGYLREPYLRITATSVAENLLSQTTYLNQSLFTDSIPTGQAPGDAAPQWRQIATTGTVRWHDHRIHWMSQQRPPVVQADPSHPHLIGSWEVNATADGQPFQIRGDLRWIGKPGTGLGGRSWLLWLIVVVDLIICLAIALAIRARMTSRQPTRPDRPRQRSMAATAPNRYPVTRAGGSRRTAAPDSDPT
jgi:hypothetical protein